MRRPVAQWTIALALLASLAAAEPSAARGDADPSPQTLALPPREALPYLLETCVQVPGDGLLLLDLDGDGAQELISYGTDPDTLSRDFVLASRLEGRVASPLKQWNFPADRGGLAGTADLERGDGREELLLWSRDDAGLELRVDGWRAHPAGPRSETLWRSERVPFANAGAGKDLAPIMHPSGRIDPAQDLWVALPVAGFGLAPRGPLLFAADGRLRRHAAMAPNVHLTALADLDGDGRPELCLGTHATCNGQVLPGEDDCHSYWRVLAPDGRRLLDAEAGGTFSEALTYPLRAQGEPPRIAALLRGVSERCPLRIYTAEGLLLRERTLPAALWHSLVVDWDRDGREELLLGLTDGRLLLLDGELELLADWRCEGPVGPLAVLDLRGRGRRELLLAVGNRLALYDDGMRPLALWDGKLSYSKQLRQRALPWTDGTGRSLVGLSRGLPAASVLLELVPAPRELAAGQPPRRLGLLLAAAAGLLAGGAAGLLWRRARRAPAPATPAAQRALRDRLRAFRHSAAARGQLDRLHATLRSCRGEFADRHLPGLGEQLAAFRSDALPLLTQIATLASRAGLGGMTGRALLADAKRLGRLAAGLERETEPARLAAAERAIRAIDAELRALQQLVDAQLAAPLAEVIGSLVARFAESGLCPQLELVGEWTDGARIADPDDADALFAALARFYAPAAGEAAPVLRLRAERRPDQLVVSCRREGAAPPAMSALEEAGIAALAGRLHRGLRCRGEDVQLAFMLEAAPRRRARGAAAG